MKTLNRWWKAFLYFLVTGSTSVFIAACYGVMYGLRIDTWVIKTHDAQGKAIPGIRVTTCSYARESETMTDTLSVDVTDASGTAAVPVNVMYDSYDTLVRATLTDTDDTANGGLFADTTVEFDNRDTTDVILRRIR